MTRPIVVTGANGRLGRALRRVNGGRHLLVDWGGPSATHPYQPYDITNANAVDRALAEVRPRAVIHLASVIGAACERDPDLAEAVNVAGAAHLAAAAHDHGVERVVFASTAAVYGTRRRRPLSEQDAVEPAGVYASTKLRGERVFERASDALAVDVLRIFNVYGPEMDDSLVNRLAAAADTAPIRLNGLDGFVRDYVHVDDVARALLAAVDSSRSGFRVLNVGSGLPRSNRQLLKAFPAAMRGRIEIGPEIDSYSCADISAITRELSWRPLASWPSVGGESLSFT
jgi:nucleoside-diphosphate-sugar epimerase